MDKIMDLYQYILKIGQTPLLSAEEEKELFESVRNGSACDSGNKTPTSI